MFTACLQPAISTASIAEITEEEVKSVQAAWANAIKSISKTYLDGGDYVAAAAKAAGELYGYGHTDYTFGYKKNADGKVRIFLHHSSVPYSVPAATPTAEITEEEVKSVQAAWASAIKSISKTYLDGGDYIAAAGKAAGELYGYGHTNYTFGYKKNADGKVRIFLHHSSVPFVAESKVQSPSLVATLKSKADRDLKQLPGLVLCESFIALFATFEFWEEPMGQRPKLFNQAASTLQLCLETLRILAIARLKSFANLESRSLLSGVHFEGLEEDRHSYTI
ncbi:unnamed protein product [Cladocopium goreaui]|uniref:Uncharacterized protein n=1 Tax=Cladocopium goreaui TaxID=2562237 RepID=A0A9P1G7U3_9DINO|nr:unnamed protein product [Cladocopium goreaui]